MKWTLGETLRAMREDADLTQTALAEKLQMTQRKISYIELGKYEPSIEDIKRICRFFDISADYLLGLTEQRNPCPEK